MAGNGDTVMIKAYFVMREDLNMTPAKLAVQIGHGTQRLCIESDKDLVNKWISLPSDSRKIVLKTKDFVSMHGIKHFLKANEIECFMIVDSGYTEFNGVTQTGFCFLFNEEAVSEEVLKKVKRIRLWN